jgi:hypothetical protein
MKEGNAISAAAVGHDAAAEARAVALESAHAYRTVFADRFVAAYALGSLAHGGYAPAVSDIDLAIIVTTVHRGDTGIVADTHQALGQRGALHRKLSVFWSSLAALRQGDDDGRFPAIDRCDLADITAQVAIPTAEELLIDGARFAVGLLASDEVIAEIREPRRLLVDPVWFTKAVLFPIRFFYSANVTRGRAARNDEAITWYLTQPQAIATQLVRLAAEVRAGQPMDPALAVPLLAAGLVDLYRLYTEDQVRRLRQAGAPADLIAAFTSWTRQLDD